MELRYVAHVVQADAHADILTLNFLQPLVGQVDLQIFAQVAEAEEWLRSCQQRVPQLQPQSFAH